MSTPHLVSAVLDLLARGDPQPVHHRTINGASISAIMDRLYFGDFHIREQLSTGPGGDRINLIGRKGPADAAPVWLVAQTGLGAPPVPAAWPDLDGDPVAPRRLPGPDRIHAFGAQSGRVDLLAKILAASAIPAHRLARPILIAALSGEEGLGSGAPLLFSEAGAQARGTAIVHAPTGGALWSRHPGCILVELVTTRRTRHRRMPPHGGFWQLRFVSASRHVNLSEPGDDALRVMLEAIAHLQRRGEVRVLSIDAGETASRQPASATVLLATQEAELPRLGAIHPDLVVSPIPDGAVVPLPIDALLESWLVARAAGVAAIAGEPGLARPTSSGLLSGAGAVTTGRLAADRDGLRGSLAIWTAPGADSEAICARFFEAAMAALPPGTTGDEVCELDGDVLAMRPAWEGSPQGSQLATATGRALSAAGLDPRVEAGLAATDAGLFASHGLETAVFGPTGPLEALYGDREAITVAALEAAFRFYTDLLERLCLGR